MLSIAWTELQPVLEPEGPRTPPAFAGPMLRGALAMALRRLVCVMRRPACDGCPLVMACLYPRLFETRPDPAAGVIRASDRAPHPILIVARLRAGAADRAGPEVLTLRLFGADLAAALYLVHAAGEMAARGLGAARVPERIVLLATPHAAALARAALLDPATGAIAAWGRDWGVPGAARLAEGADLVVAESDSGDTDAEAGALAFAEAASRVLARLTADPATELHVSLAGGCKAAAALIAILMSVLGRPQDRLSHVLIQPEGAAGAGLFYPAPGPRPVVAQGAALDAAALRVVLFDIPFPRLALGSDAAGARADFFDRLSAQARAVRLRLDAGDAGGARLLWDGRPMPMPPALAAFVAWPAAEQAAGRAGVPRVGAARTAHLAPCGRFAGTGAALAAAPRLPDPLDPEWIEEGAARANKAAEATGARPRGARLIQRLGDRARALYRLALDPAEIAIAGSAP